MMLQKFIDLILPPTCKNCYQIVQDDHSLCSQCWKKIQFITDPYCYKCGLPLPYGEDSKAELLCGQCLKMPKIYHQVRAVARYDDICKNLIYRFKYGDQPELAGLFAKWFLYIEYEWFLQFDIIAPIPLHYYRQVRRHYNQSIELIHALQNIFRVMYKIDDLPIYINLLKRVKYTTFQGRLNATERMKNIKGAFQIAPAYRDRLKNKKILLIDDIFTTGATAHYATDVLINEGKCSQVSILTIARA